MPAAATALVKRKQEKPGAGLAVTSNGDIKISVGDVQGLQTDGRHMKRLEQRNSLLDARIEAAKIEIKELYQQLYNKSPEYRKIRALEEKLLKDKKLKKETLIKIDGEYERALRDFEPTKTAGQKLLMLDLESDGVE